MEITEVKVFPIQEEKLKAFVSIVFDQCFMVNDIKIIRGKDGLFVSMPSRKRKNGDFKDVAHPLNSETRRWVEDRILGSYRAARAEGGAVEEVVSLPSPEPAEAHRPALAAVAAMPAMPEMAAAPAMPAAPQPAADPEPKPVTRSLEELERRHLGDSFWGMT